MRKSMNGNLVRKRMVLSSMRESLPRRIQIGQLIGAKKAVCDINGENSALLGARMSSGFRKLQRQLATRFSGLSNRLTAVVNYQHDQMRHWEPRRIK